MSNAYEVHVLFDGYSKTVENGTKANCTSTLLKGPKNIIIDTMTAWDGPKLESAINQHNLKCSNIDYVICTHGHSDHIGCNYLFQNAIHIVGFSVSKDDHYFEHDFQINAYVIDDFVKIIATPGHTLQDVSVILTLPDKTFAITGDLFEKEEDLLDDAIWMDAGSDDEVLQRKNRALILSFADYVIPGHGPLFINVKK